MSKNKRTAKVEEPREEEPQESVDRRYWPKGKAMPTGVRKIRRVLVPCPKCRRVLLDDLSQVAVCQHSGSDIAWFRCKFCGNTWKLGIKMVG